MAPKVETAITEKDYAELLAQIKEFRETLNEIHELLADLIEQFAEAQRPRRW